MKGYKCDKCDWQYDWWRMGDRVQAVKRHQLAHLLEQPTPPERIEVHAGQLVKYLDERLKKIKLM